MCLLIVKKVQKNIVCKPSEAIFPYLITVDRNIAIKIDCIPEYPVHSCLLFLAVFFL